MTNIVIVDYGLGNLRSARKGMEKVGTDVIISSDPEDIRAADGLVLPGVGAFRDGMANVRKLESLIHEEAESGIPILGICLGMQMLFTESEEGGLIRGLDLIPGRVVRFKEGLKVPHMGWNDLQIKRDHPLLEDIPEGSYVYFVHSYYADTSSEYILATTDYGREFAAIVANKQGNVVGTQFHPEKSGEPGLKMLENFVHMCE